MEVKNKITVYEVNGVDPVKLHGEAETLIIRSHEASNKFVILEHSGKSLTVDASDLQRAARNATNTRY